MINPNNLELREKLLAATFGRLKRHRNDDNLSVQSMGDVIVAFRFDADSVVYFNEQGESIKVASDHFDAKYKNWYDVKTQDAWKLYYRPQGSYHHPVDTAGFIPDQIVYAVKKLLASRDVSIQQAGIAYRKAMGPEGQQKLDRLLGIEPAKKGFGLFGKRNAAVATTALHPNDF